MTPNAMLIVDALNEFVYGSIRGSAPERILPVLQRLRDAARSGGVPVVYCCDEHWPVDRELTIWGPHAMRGSDAAQVVPALRPEHDDYVVPKRTYSGFYDTALDSLLRDLGATRLYVTGFYTDPCVRHTVADAFLRRYEVVVVSDAVAALDAGRHQEYLAYMERFYGVRLMDADHAVTAFAPAVAPGDGGA